jgi:hypothetical protein
MVSPRQARDKHRENSKSDDGAGSGGGMAGADGRMAAAYLLWTILFFDNQIQRMRQSIQWNLWLIQIEGRFRSNENEATTQFESQSDVTLYVFTGEQVPAVSSAADCEARGRDRCERTLFPFFGSCRTLSDDDNDNFVMQRQTGRGKWTKTSNRAAAGLFCFVLFCSHWNRARS